MSGSRTNPLAERLLEVAVEADWSAHNAAVLKAVGQRGVLEEKRRKIGRARSVAVVVAVLRELAEGLPPAWSGLPESLTGLAGVVEEGEKT